MASSKPSASGGSSKDKSPKASSNNVTQPHLHPEVTGPRKTVSHEGFQHSKSASQSAAMDPKSSSHSSSSTSLSAFSYLKQKLFGTVADASSSLSSSARDLLQSKKGQSNDALSKAKAVSKDNNTSGSSIGGASPAATSGAAASSSSPASSGGRSRFAARTLPSRQPLALQQHLAPPAPLPSVNNITTTSPLQQQQHHSAMSAVSSSTKFPSTNTLAPSPQSSPTSATAASVASAHHGGPNSSSPDKPSSSSSSTQLITRPTSTYTPNTPSRVSYSQARNSNYRLSTLSSHKSAPTASIIYQEGFLNKKADLQPGEIGQGWKVYKVILRGTKLYFFKPLSFEEKPKFQEPRDNQRLIEVSYSATTAATAQSSSSRLSLTNESGMVLAAFKFESSTRTLLFEGNPKPLHPQSWAAAPLVSKYVYGECFTELDRMSMQPKKHVALLLFEDCIVICKRKWIRFPSAKMKDVIKFNNSQKLSAEDSPTTTTVQQQQEQQQQQQQQQQQRQRRFYGLNVSSLRSTSHQQQQQRQQQQDARATETDKEKQRGYFTKWKHEAMYSLSQVEALDMASPVPSASNTFFPFVTPTIPPSSGVPTVSSRTNRDSENLSATPSTLPVPFIHQTTSTLELIITSSIDGKEYTQRFLFLPPSPEVRHMWYSKFHRTKERYHARSRTADGRGSMDSLHTRDSLTVRSALPSNQSTQSLASSSSPSRPSFDHATFFDPNSTEKTRVFADSTMHPELQTNPDMSGAERLVAASVQGIIHELIFHNIPDPGMDVLSVFITTMPLFTTTSQVLKTLKQITEQSNHLQTTKSAVQIVQALLRAYNPRVDSRKRLDELKAFVYDTLSPRLDDEAQVSAILSDMEQKRSAESPDAIQITVGASNATTTTTAATSSFKMDASASSAAPVDLSNVLITGLTPAVFLRLEPDHFAEQIFHYHANRLNDTGGLERLLENPSFFMRRYPTAGAKSSSLQSPLVFSMFSPHFLTVLITHHILIATQSAQSISRRPILLSHWIKTGRCCRALGDMAGFVAIAIGICSPGIVRLQETWKDIDQELRDEVATLWVKVLVDMGMVTEEWQGSAATVLNMSSRNNQVDPMASQQYGGNGEDKMAIPCMSRVKQAIDVLDRSQPSFVQASPTPLLNMDKLNSIAAILRSAKENNSMTATSAMVALHRPAIPHIQQYFGHLASISQSLHDQFHSNELINDAFESSLACEPHFNGQYLDYHYKNRKIASSYIPLLFPEAIPMHRLFHQQTLLALECAGNAYRQSSMDEEYDKQRLKSPTGTHSSGTPFRKNPPASSTYLPSNNTQPEWATNGDDSTVMHHGGESSGEGSMDYPKIRKRTYSFPPTRHAAGRQSTVVGGHTLRTIINMINPHLDVITRDWLLSQSSQTIGGQGPNEILQAMQDLAGMGCKLLLMEGGELVLKIKDESLESLAHAGTVDHKHNGLEPWRTPPSQPAPQPTQRNLSFHHDHSKQGSSRSSATLSIYGGRRPVTVKCGTLEMLVQVLVMGLQGMSGYVIDDTAASMMLLTSRQLLFDHRVYAASFFATYRSFCSAGGLLEHLVTMFTFAQQSTLSRATSGGIPSGFDMFTRPVTMMSPDSCMVGDDGGDSATSRNNGAGGLVDWKSVLTMQRNVLSTIEYWLQHHYSDFLDHLALKEKLCEAIHACTVQEQTQVVLIDRSLASEAAVLTEQLTRLRRLAVQQTMRPLDEPVLPRSLERLRDHLGVPPPTEPVMGQELDAQTLLEQMNLSAMRHFLSIGQQEWFVLFEILESQSADPLGWYVSKAASNFSSSALPSVASTAEDELMITNIHDTLYSIRRSGVAGSNWNGERLINAIPVPLQKLCKLHHTVRSFVVSQVADPTISYEQRLSRVQRLVDLVLLSREEMTRFDLQTRDAAAAGSTLSSSASVSTSKSGGGNSNSSGGGGVPGHASTDVNKVRKLPSFVEAAVVSALISPEVRAYSRVWTEVAASRRGTLDSFEDMLGECVVLSRPPTAWAAASGKKGRGNFLAPLAPATTHEGLVPSIGWLIERMIEASCYVRDMSYESSILVNFDKRRYVYDLVQVFVHQQQLIDQAPIPAAQPLASWLGLAAGTSPTNLNLKMIREASIKDSQAATTQSRLGLALGSRNQNSRSGGSRGGTGLVVFSRLVSAQQDKMKRDQKEYDKLERQIKETQGRIQKAQQEHAKSLEKQIKMEQSRSRVKNQLLKTTLLRAVRPISLAISNSFSLATTTVSNATAHGMPATPTSMSGSGGVTASSGHTTEISESSVTSDTSLGARLLGHTRLDDPRRLGANTQALVGGSPPQIQPRSTSLSNNQNGNGNGNSSNVLSKSALVINLINASCSIAYTYTKRDYVFKIVMEEGRQTLLQALDYDDMLRWINIINEAATEATAKRRTLLEMEDGKNQESKDGSRIGSSSTTTLQADDGIADAAVRTEFDKSTLPSGQDVTVFEDVALAIDVNERKGRKSVFGVELRHLMPDGRVPEIVEKCITEIEKRGLDEVGIYRVPGAVSAINKLRTAFNTDSASVDLASDEWKDINVVAGALKQFLRELPEAVMTSALYEPLIAASTLEDYDERLMTIKDLVHTLPLANYMLLKRIIEHLERVTDFEEINHMYATNLAIVFGPTLVRPGGASASSFARSMKNLGLQQAIVKNMILQYHWLFDVEQEGGREEDDNEGDGEHHETEDQAYREDAEGDLVDEEEDVETEDEEGVGVYDEENPIMLDTSTFQLRLPQFQRRVVGDQPALADLSMAQPVVTTDMTGEKLSRNQRRRTVIFG